MKTDATIGLLPLYLKLYDKTDPPRRTKFDSFLETIKDGLSEGGGTVVPAPICCVEAEVSEALGIPLHGQRADYLQYALESYLNGSRENLLPEMEEKIRQLDHDDIRALINYYVSY